MSNHTSPDKILTKPVACWLTKRDYDRLMSVSSKNNVRVAVFIRSIIIDALADEDEIAERKNGVGQSCFKGYLDTFVQRGS